MQRNLTLLLYALIAIGALAGLFAASRRYSVEQHNRRVELALDYTEVEALAQVAGQPLDQVMARFKQAGATSVAITEDTLSSLEQQGALHTQNWVEPSTVTVGAPELLEQIRHGLAARGWEITDDPLDRHSTVFELYSAESGDEQPSADRPEGFAVPGDWATLREFGIGLPADAVETARGAGMAVVGRISNFPGVSPESMRAVLADLQSVGVSTVVFVGLEVLGYRGLQKDAAAAVREAGLQFGQVEFGKQKGDDALGAALRGDYVRVHSISEGEMSQLDERDAIDRFVRAARERNIRLCYIRLLSTAGADPVAANEKYLGAIARGVQRGTEMALGPARTYPETFVPVWAFALIGLGVGAALTLLVLRIIPLTDSRAALLLIIAAGGCAVAAFLMAETGRKLVGLLAALVFPTLACLRRDLLEPHAVERQPATDARTAMVRAVQAIISASAVTGLGIIAVVGLMSTRPFMLKATQFMGIKAAHAIPLLIIAAAAVAGLPRLNRPWASERAALKARLREVFSEPLRVGTMAVLFVGLVALAMVLARTGNEPGVGVSGLEMKFRALLDRALPVRPRTKEFLIGHPAFILALALWFRGRRKWVLPLFLVGVIGQVSILNTFCHGHTPLRLSFIRDVTGLVFGTVLGLAAFLAVEKLAGSPRSENVEFDTSPPVPAGRET